MQFFNHQKMQMCPLLLLNILSSFILSQEHPYVSTVWSLSQSIRPEEYVEVIHFPRYYFFWSSNNILKTIAAYEVFYLSPIICWSTMWPMLTTFCCWLSTWKVFKISSIRFSLLCLMMVWPTLWKSLLLSRGVQTERRESSMTLKLSLRSTIDQFPSTVDDEQKYLGIKFTPGRTKYRTQLDDKRTILKNQGSLTSNEKCGIIILLIFTKMIIPQPT